MARRRLAGGLASERGKILVVLHATPWHKSEMPQPKGDWVMLLARKAWYGLIAVKHLAEQPRQNSFSAKDLANSYGFPQEALAKILQGLARAGLLLSHHGIKGGYTLVRDPDQISVLRRDQGERRNARRYSRTTLAALGVPTGLPPIAHGQPNR